LTTSPPSNNTTLFRHDRQMLQDSDAITTLPRSTHNGWIWRNLSSQSHHTGQTRPSHKAHLPHSLHIEYIREGHIGRAGNFMTVVSSAKVRSLAVWKPKTGNKTYGRPFSRISKGWEVWARVWLLKSR